MLKHSNPSPPSSHHDLGPGLKKPDKDGRVSELTGKILQMKSVSNFLPISAQQIETIQASFPNHEGEGSNTETATTNTSQATHPRNRWRCMQPRVCEYCWKTFSNSFNLKQHIVNVHIQSQGVTCTMCDKVTWICKFLQGFVKLVLCISCPLPKINRLKFDQDFKTCWSFCFEIELLNLAMFAICLSCSFFS